MQWLVSNRRRKRRSKVWEGDARQTRHQSQRTESLLAEVAMGQARGKYQRRVQAYEGGSEEGRTGMPSSPSLAARVEANRQRSAQDRTQQNSKKS